MYCCDRHCYYGSTFLAARATAPPQSSADGTYLASVALCLHGAPALYADLCRSDGCERASGRFRNIASAYISFYATCSFAWFHTTER